VIHKYKELIKDYAIITVATALIACAVFFFLMPSNLSVGSVAGLAIVLSNFIPLSVSTLTLIFNVVLLLIGFLLIGRDFGAVHNYSEQVAAKIDAEISGMIKSAFAKAEEILSEKADKVHAVSAYLMEHEKMDASEFNSFFAQGEGTPAVDTPEEAETLEN